MEPVTHALDDLLRHERFVQRLAKSLLSTTGEADDLVQETWLRAVQHPAEERGLAVGWLRKVCGTRAGLAVRRVPTPAARDRRGANRRHAASTADHRASRIAAPDR
jgi:DNA-directed RNA polymerase specialized sigma24 family protein